MNKVWQHIKILGIVFWEACVDEAKFYTTSIKNSRPVKWIKESIEKFIESSKEFAVIIYTMYRDLIINISIHVYNFVIYHPYIVSTRILFRSAKNRITFWYNLTYNAIKDFIEKMKSIIHYKILKFKKKYVVVKYRITEPVSIDGYTKKITRFVGEYGFLSNMYPSKISFDGIEYPTVEHVIQACKVKSPTKKLMISRHPIRDTVKTLVLSEEVRDDWNRMKYRIMKKVLSWKFQDPQLKERLLETKEYYLEYTNEECDNYWGICDCVICNDEKREGFNMLGKLLMEIRDQKED